MKTSHHQRATSAPTPECCARRFIVPKGRCRASRLRGPNQLRRFTGRAASVQPGSPRSARLSPVPAHGCPHLADPRHARRGRDETLALARADTCDAGFGASVAASAIIEWLDRVSVEPRTSRWLVSQQHARIVRKRALRVERISHRGEDSRQRRRGRSVERAR